MPKGKVIATPIDENEDVVCNYGCGKKAKFRFTNGKVCCSTIHTKCDANKKHLSEKNSGKSNTGILFENNDNLICDFGCGQVAKYKFKNGKYCCSEMINSCDSVRKRMSISMVGKTSKGIPIENSEILCEFGCNQIAKYKFKLGKYCCSEVWENCPNSRKLNSENIKNLWKEDSFKNKIVAAIRDSRDETFSENQRIKKIKEWDDPNSKLNSIERSKKLSRSKTMGLEKLKNKYPDFISIRGEENVREDLETKQIIIKCDFCEKWFIPHREYLYEATFRSTTSLPYFYMLCSEECFEKSGIQKKEWLFSEEFKKYKAYSYKVIKETEKTVRKYGSHILNLNLRGKYFELDHKFSIIEGFKLNVSIDIMSHVKNLQILSTKENKVKLGKSSITLEELITEIKLFI